MAYSFQELALASEWPEEEAVLVFRGGRLLAVLSRLSGVHGELAGRWFVEALFRGQTGSTVPTFAALEDFCSWADELR